jgi:chromosome segregation ATPase
MRRLRRVAILSPEAKAEAKALGLARNQSALMDAAKETLPEGQVAKLRERAVKKRLVRNSIRKPQQQTMPAESEAEIQHLRSELMAVRKELANVQQELASAQSQMDSIPPFLQRLAPELESAFQQLVVVFDRELMPSLATAPISVREKFHSADQSRVPLI